ncbi:MAG: 2-C-methyl-D-erythritol 4-phosphate cytidylyltransferase, partial [Chloroflexi bacterium]|nr:2-C-methyl-D-erythritol 4-phosphate cytidylyltransferase [Chloroflexota bacterium]
MKEQGSSMRVVAVVLGAGQGRRMGYAINKVFLPINGKPVIIHALETFERCPSVDEVLLVAAAGEEEQLTKLAHHAQCHKVRHVIQGGATRHASEQCALDMLRAHITTGAVEIVLIHDGARPFIRVDQVEQLIKKAYEVGGAILAAPVQEEEQIVQVDADHRVQQSLQHQRVWKAQTPQVFRASLLLEAYDRAAHDQFYGTDTASSVERIGGTVAIVESEVTNIKITTAHDLFYAEKLSRQQNLQ